LSIRSSRAPSLPISALLGLADERRAFGRYRAIREAERTYL